MSAGTLFKTPISCGMLAGALSAGLWAFLSIELSTGRNHTLTERFILNAFFAVVCLATALCAPAIYFRKFSLLGTALKRAIVAGILVYGFEEALWLIVGSFYKSNAYAAWQHRYIVYSIISHFILCPLLGMIYGHTLAQLYKVPHISGRVKLYGALGSVVHLILNNALFLGYLLKLNIDRPEVTALTCMFAMLGYIFLGGVAAIPIDASYRLRSTEYAIKPAITR